MLPTHKVVFRLEDYFGFEVCPNEVSVWTEMRMTGVEKGEGEEASKQASPPTLSYPAGYR
jgi:hypothetical protein